MIIAADGLGFKKCQNVLGSLLSTQGKVLKKLLFTTHSWEASLHCLVLISLGHYYDIPAFHDAPPTFCGTTVIARHANELRAHNRNSNDWRKRSDQCPFRTKSYLSYRANVAMCPFLDWFVISMSKRHNVSRMCIFVYTYVPLFPKLKVVARQRLSSFVVSQIMVPHQQDQLHTLTCIRLAIYREIPLSGSLVKRLRVLVFQLPSTSHYGVANTATLQAPFSLLSATPACTRI